MKSPSRCHLSKLGWPVHSDTWLLAVSLLWRLRCGTGPSVGALPLPLGASAVKFSFRRILIDGIYMASIDHIFDGILVRVLSFRRMSGKTGFYCEKLFAFDFALLGSCLGLVFLPEMKDDLQSRGQQKRKHWQQPLQGGVAPKPRSQTWLFDICEPCYNQNDVSVKLAKWNCAF